MKNRFSPPGLFTTVIAASVFVISGTIGLLAYTSARSVKKENDRSIQRIQHDLRRLEQTIEAMNRRLTASGEKNPVASVQGNAMPTDGAAAVQPGGLSPKAELTRLKKLIDSTDQEQLRLKKIVESTGLDRLAKMENIDPDILKKLYDEHSQRNIIDEHRAYLREKNDEFHQLDALQYDQELSALYQRARARGRGATEREDRDKAFQEMQSRYPEAYATGMVIAERGLVSAFRRDAGSAEQYYTMLRENENFSDIVSDRGVEAVPNLEYYLADRYIREGRTGEAQQMLESLEKNYSGSLVFIRGRGRGLSWQPVSEAVSALRSSMNR